MESPKLVLRFCIEGGEETPNSGGIEGLQGACFDPCGRLTMSKHLTVSGLWGFKKRPSRFLL